MKRYSTDDEAYERDVDELKEHWDSFCRDHLQEAPHIKRGEIVVLDDMMRLVFDHLESA